MRFAVIAFFLFANQSYALINGTPLKGFRDLVRITLGAGESVCTGFFVTPTIVITAAHCFYSSKDGKLLEVQGLETMDGELMDVQVLSLDPHPEYYKDGWSSNDVGIIRTTENKYFRGSFILSGESPSYLGRARMMGAGRIRLDPKQYGRSEGSTHYLQVGKFLYSLGGTSVAPNDSGGPLLADKKVIGILSKSTASLVDGTVLPALSVMTPLGSETNRKFIEMNLKKKSDLTGPYEKPVRSLFKN